MSATAGRLGLSAAVLAVLIYLIFPVIVVVAISFSSGNFLVFPPPGFSLRCRFTTWLFQVAKNRVLDELRARDRKPQAVVTLDDLPPLEVVDAPPERVEAIDAVWRAVAQLNPDLKMALLLRDVVGLPYTEIADALEITLATVKWRIFKAREEVQLALEREGIEVEVARQPAAQR